MTTIGLSPSERALYEFFNVARETGYHIWVAVGKRCDPDGYHVAGCVTAVDADLARVEITRVNPYGDENYRWCLDFEDITEVARDDDHAPRDRRGGTGDTIVPGMIVTHRFGAIGRVHNGPQRPGDPLIDVEWDCLPGVIASTPLSMIKRGVVFDGAWIVPYVESVHGINATPLAAGWQRAYRRAKGWLFPWL